MKTIEYNEIITKSIVTSEDGNNTYEINISLSNASKDSKTGIFIMLYPTRTRENLIYDDSSLNHIIQHSRELGFTNIKIVNLFSKVVRTGKISYRGLEIDTANLDYLNKAVFAKLNPKKDFVIMAYGSSMTTSAACNETKKFLFDRLMEYPSTYQLSVETLSIKNEIAIHPLFLGIRAKNAKWTLEPFPFMNALNALPVNKKSGENV